MNVLYLSNGRNLEPLKRLADFGSAVKVWCPNAPLELFMIPGIEVIDTLKNGLNWAEVAIADSLEHSAAYTTIAATLPTVGLGEQLDKLPLRQGDVWYRLGVPAWRLCPSPSNFVWGVFGSRGLEEPARDARGERVRAEWALEPLSRYLKHVGFVGPMGVWWARYRFSKYIVALDYEKAYAEWMSLDMHPLERIKELTCPLVI